MSALFWDMLAQNLARSGGLDKLSPHLRQTLRSLSDGLAIALSSSDAATRAEIESKLCTEVLDHLPELETVARQGEGGDNKEATFGKIPPEIMEWARQQVNEEEAAAGLREIRETGGLELADFLHELEQEAMPHD